MTTSPFYVTTPIYYVNDRPHIGHCYTTTLADVAARFARLARGGPAPSDPGVFFLTGTDENADKVVTSAAENRTTPQAWADRNAEEFRKAFAEMGVANDDFIRTTQPRHTTAVTRYISALLKSGDIYRGEYTGWYDEGQEEYLTETLAREQNFVSAVSKRPLVKRTEPCYFFRLGKYQKALVEHIEKHPEFVRPDARRAEVLGRLRTELHDVPISRPVTDDPATQWGIRVPGDDANRIYVWIDALFNYLSVVDTPERRRFWESGPMHLIGKDILWFHAVIWPALLMALRASGPEYAWVALPRSVYGHGWWVSEGQKMSKSLGNFIDLEKLRGYARRYSLDAVRYFLASNGPLSGSDSDFSHAKFVEVFNADLANGVGNCVSRVSNMIEKYFAGVLPAPGDAGPEARALREAAGVNAAEIARRAEACEVDAALRAGVSIVTKVDEFIAQTRPFSIAKTAQPGTPEFARLGAILYDCAEALRIATLLLWPAMPAKMESVWNAWGCVPAKGAALADLARFGGPHALKPGSTLRKGEALFMRADPAEAAPERVEA
jgi:methionyl-tRNA synthetase